MSEPTTTQHTTSDVITPEHAAQYAAEGYFVLESVLSEDQLSLLRDHAETAIERIDAEMDAAGVDQLRLNHRGRRYFAKGMAAEYPRLHDFLFDDLLADICRATIGPEAHLFFDQYVIKGTDPRSSFSWHQDSGYVHEDHTPYVTCWIALDDVTEENGSVYLLPYSRAGVRTYVKHFEDPETNDRIGYVGTDPGDPVVVPAGSIAVFSSVVFHRSGPNLTDQLRRVFLAQYSPEVIRHKDGVTPWAGFEPFLSEGKRVGSAGSQG